MNHLHLQFSGSPTKCRVLQHDPPWKVVRSFDAGDGASLVHLNNVSGGILGGDHLALDIDVAHGASAQLTTTGATRIYRSGGEPASQIANVHAAGTLEYLPDAIIPYRGSRFSQSTHIDLAPGASLFWWEVVSPGREAAGELFQYDSLAMEMKICSQGRPLAIERFVLSQRPWLGPFTHFATFYICHTGPFDWECLEARLRPITGEARWGVSTLAAHGLVVRGLATRSRHLFSGLLEFWRVAKQEITGKPAVPPRKLY
jgi:urease accessory protein